MNKEGYSQNFAVHSNEWTRSVASSSLSVQMSAHCRKCFKVELGGEVLRSHILFDVLVWFILLKTPIRYRSINNT